MISRTSWAGGAILLTTVALVLALVAVQATRAIASRSSQAEAQFVELINQSRASAGVADVSHAADMARVAYDWSQEMASSGELAHNPRLR